MLSAFQRARLVGDDWDHRRQANIIDRRQRRIQIGRRSCRRPQRSGHGPDPPVAVGRLHVEVVKFPLDDFVVGLAVDKLEPCPAAVGGIAVGDPIAVEPEKILVGDGLLQPGQRAGITGWMRAEERLIDKAGDLVVTLLVGMDAVVRERLSEFCVGLLRGREEIDAHNAIGLADLFHGIGIESEVRVMRLTIWPMRPGEVLVGDRGKHHQLWGIHAVVFLGERVLDECLDVLSEGVEAGRTGVGLVGSEEGEDHIGLRAGEFKPVLTDGRLVLDVVRLGDRGRAGEPLVGRAEIGTAQPLGKLDFIAVVGEIPDHEPLLGKPALEQGFQPAGVLHPVGHAAADDADVVALMNLQPAGLGPSRPHNHPARHHRHEQNPRDATHAIDSRRRLFISL